MFPKIKNSNVWTDKFRIPMLGEIRPEFQCLERYGGNLNVWTDKFRIPMLGQIKPEFQCLEG